MHWHQPRRGCRGHIPQYFGWGDVNGNIPQYYYVLSDIAADQYWLPSVRSASSRCGEGCSPPTPTPFGVSSPPTLNSRWRHCFNAQFTPTARHKTRTVVSGGVTGTPDTTRTGQSCRVWWAMWIEHNALSNSVQFPAADHIAVAASAAWAQQLGRFGGPDP